MLMIAPPPRRLISSRGDDREQKGAAHVQAEDRVEVLRRQLQRRLRDSNACVVDEHVDASERLDRLAPEPLTRHRVAHVADEPERSAGGRELLVPCPRVVVVPVRVEAERKAVLLEPPRDCPADACPAPVTRATFSTFCSFPRVADRIQLFATCLGDLFFPDAVADAERLLRTAGYEVEFPRKQVCCGQPAFNAGHRGAARRVARTFARAFSPRAAGRRPLGLLRDDGRALPARAARARARYEVHELSASSTPPAWRSRG